MSIRASRQLKAWLMAIGVAVSLTSAACYMGPRGVDVGADFEVGGPPPAPQDEVVVATPGPDYVWVGGRYEWTASTKAYAWTPGAWVHPPHPHAVWVGPRYEERGGRRVYHSGHWQR